MPKMPKVPKMSKIEDLTLFYIFFSIEVNIASKFRISRNQTSRNNQVAFG